MPAAFGKESPWLAMSLNCTRKDGCNQWEWTIYSDRSDLHSMVSVAHLWSRRSSEGGQVRVLRKSAEQSIARIC
jgi:hypothetical protein